MSDALTSTDDGIQATRGRSILELRQCDDGRWEASQFDVDVTGTGETGALAAMEYCQKIAEGQHDSQR